jgi:fatty acid synthase
MVDLSENRWKGIDGVPKYAGFMPRIEKFDAEFFGFSPESTNSMDPQGRLLLEHAFEAIMDAGKYHKK